LMSYKAVLIVAILTLLNLATLAINVSIQAKAEIAGMSWRELYRDRDFRWAVGAVVEDCTISDTSISC
jgi:hypothetical protein